VKAPQEPPAHLSVPSDRVGVYLCFWLFLGFAVTFHLWFIASGRLDLAPDEAYYWTWSNRLGWSYYSKGPMVAYLIALSTRLGGDTEFYVRLPAVILSAGTGLLTFLLARKICGSARAGLDAVLLVGATPLAQAGSILMTIDTPLVFFWVLVLFSTQRALEGNHTGWWLLTGAALGFGLLSKYTMAVMIPQVFLYLALSRSHRSWIGRPGPYLALGTGLLLFVPVVWWNATHGWISFRHLFSQIGGGKIAVSPLKSLGEFAGSQIAVVTPILFTLLMIGMWRVGRAALGRHADDASLFLFCGSVPLLLVCLLVSLWTKVQANWAAPTYIAAAIAAAAWLSGSSRNGIPYRRTWAARSLFVSALLTGFLVSGIGYLPQSLASVGLPHHQELDPTVRLRGWKELGLQVSEMHQEMNRSRPTFLFSDQYGIASEMMFYVPGHPKTYNIPLWRRMNQFDVWGGTEEVLGWDAIFVSGRTGELPSAILRSFESVHRDWPHHLATLDQKGSWSIFRCHGFRGFPPLKPQGY
jgi:4-amino-4-deoxy-L-arabinose transferase-like glycosyltransferase